MAAPRSVTVRDLIAAFAEARMQNERVLTLLGHEYGIPTNDFRAVSLINREPEVTPKRVAEYLRLTMGAMTTLVDRLVNAGLVVREPHPRDGRSVLLRPTELGVQASRDALAVYDRVFEWLVVPSQNPYVERLFLDMAAEFQRIADEWPASHRD